MLFYRLQRVENERVQCFWGVPYQILQRKDPEHMV